MNKYIQNPEYVIDLHGFTTYETQVILDELIEEGGGRVSRDGTRHNSAELHIRVIIGKGLNSENGPVLPDFVKNYLNARNIRFNQSKIQDGGAGALEVFL